MSHISMPTEPSFTRSSRKMAKWAAIKKISFWCLNSFWLSEMREVQKCHFSAAPAESSFTKSTRRWKKLPGYVYTCDRQTEERTDGRTYILPQHL